MTISPNKWELDTQAYLNTCNITAATPRKQLRDFAYGVDELGLWNSMVCWPLRSSQNIGTGTTAFSFGGLGTFNGALINGPTYGADGINFVNSNASIDIGANATFTTGSFSMLAATNMVASFNSNVCGLFAHNPSNPTRGFVCSIFGASGHATANFNGLTGGFRRVGQILGIPNVGVGPYFVSCGVEQLENPATTSGFIQRNAIRNTNKSGTGNLPYTFVDNNFFLFGHSGSRNETAAFQAWFKVQLDAPQVALLQNLYKSTLGIGLALP